MSLKSLFRRFVVCADGAHDLTAAGIAVSKDQRARDTSGYAPPGRKGHLGTGRFDGEDFIAFNRRFQRRSVYDRLFRERGAARNIVIETGTSHTVLEMVRRGAGVVLINPFPFILHECPEVVFRKFVLEGDYATSFVSPLGPVTLLCGVSSNLRANMVPEIAVSARFEAHPDLTVFTHPEQHRTSSIQLLAEYRI